MQVFILSPNCICTFHWMVGTKEVMKKFIILLLITLFFNGHLQACFPCTPNWPAYFTDMHHPWLYPSAPGNARFPTSLYWNPDIILDPIQWPNFLFFPQYLVTHWSLSCLFIALFTVSLQQNQGLFLLRTTSMPKTVLGIIRIIRDVFVGWAAN